MGYSQNRQMKRSTAICCLNYVIVYYKFKLYVLDFKCYFVDAILILLKMLIFVNHSIEIMNEMENQRIR